jgi:hypothetical protein
VSVVGKKTIFCEGKNNSLDYRLLLRVVEDLSGDPPTIVPAGSKFTFSVFAEGYFYPDETSSQRYIVFRDRDFDVAPSEEIKLLEMTNRRGTVFARLTHRACIENYLLDANLIHEYWNMEYANKQENPSSKWGYKNSPGIDVIADWIESSARDLQEYQAVRWALADLLQMSQARTQLRTTWTGGSGRLPRSLTLSACQGEAQRLVTEFVEAVAVVTPETFEASLVKYRNQFSEVEFWSGKHYLIWFHGKDIQKMMQTQKPNFPPLKTKNDNDFFNWAVSQLDITAYPDLMNLRERIQQLNHP